MTESGTATVLFTDLVGSTELMARLGDVAFDRLRTDHFARLRQTVAAHGGTEVKNTGDGILATFASTVGALAAAVAAQQAADDQARSSGVPVAIRVGVSVGEVAFEDGDVFGTPVVEAARLVGAARPGQILATSLTRLLAGSRAGAAFAELGDMSLKGLPDPVPVCEVLWEPAAVVAVPLPALVSGTPSIFVARDDELDRLMLLWKETVASGRRIAFLGGEPGVGKTRLAVELATRVHREGAIVLAGRCDEDLGVPYQPFVEALRHYLAHATEARLGRHAGELVRLVPKLADLAPDLPEPVRSDPETERFRLFDAVASWLSDVSADAPVLLVLDDLHWAAKPTLLLLRHVLRTAGPLSLLVVATYRDTDIGRGHPLTGLLADYRRDEVAERFSLRGFDRAGVGAYIEAAAGHDLRDRQGQEFIDAVSAETEGNPFFVLEVLRHLRESGLVEQREGRWATKLAVADLGIPEGVREVVGRRLSRLAETTHRVLAVASVVGLVFDPRVVRGGGGLSEDEVLLGLEEAAGARLVEELPGTPGLLRFAHGLVRTTLYEELSAARRVALHRHVAEAIEELHAGRLDDHLPTLSHHWSRAVSPAADTAKAIEYATRAGDRALELLAHDEAVSYYRQALNLLAAAPEPKDGLLAVELAIRLGDAQRRAGDDSFRAVLLGAFDAARAQGDAARMARAALANSRGTFSTVGEIDAEKVEALRAALAALGEDGLSAEETAWRARLLATLGVEMLWSGDRAAPSELSAEALRIVRRLDDPRVLGSVLVLRWSTLWAPQFARERLDLAAELLSIANVTGDPYLRFWAQWRSRIAFAELGNVEAGQAAAAAAERQADELGQMFPRWCVALTRATDEAVAGRLGAAEAAAAQALTIAREGGQPDAEVGHTMHRAMIRLEQRRLGEMLPALRQLASERPAVPLFAALVALATAELGRVDEARVEFRRLAPQGNLVALVFDYFAAPTVAVLAQLAATLDDRDACAALVGMITPYRNQVASNPMISIGCFAHYLALLHTALEQWDDAEECFRMAAATHASLAAPLWSARSRQRWDAMIDRRAR